MFSHFQKRVLPDTDCSDDIPSSDLFRDSDDDDDNGHRAGPDSKGAALKKREDYDDVDDDVDGGLGLSEEEGSDGDSGTISTISTIGPIGPIGPAASQIFQTPEFPLLKPVTENTKRGHARPKNKDLDLWEGFFPEYHRLVVQSQAVQTLIIRRFAQCGFTVQFVPFESNCHYLVDHSRIRSVMVENGWPEPERVQLCRHRHSSRTQPGRSFETTTLVSGLKMQLLLVG
jgi:hypothetical protein